MHRQRNIVSSLFRSELNGQAPRRVHASSVFTLVSALQTCTEADFATVLLKLVEKLLVQNDEKKRRRMGHFVDCQGPDTVAAALQRRGGVLGVVSGHGWSSMLRGGLRCSMLDSQSRVLHSVELMGPTLLSDAIRELAEERLDMPNAVAIAIERPLTDVGSSEQELRQRAKEDELRTACMVLLRNAVQTDEGVARALSVNDHLLACLFDQMRLPGTFSAAIELVEELLAVRAEYGIEAFDVSANVRGFADLAMSLPARQLAVFCRTLSHLLFDSERFSFDTLSSTEQLARDRKQARLRAVDRNQAFVLSIPGLLERLVLLLREQKIVYGVWVNRLLERIPLTNEILLLLLTVCDESDSWDVIGRRCEPMATIGEDIQDIPAVSLHSITLATQQSDLLTVLCSLANGRRKREVQRELSRLGAIPAIERFFQAFQWDHEHISASVAEADQSGGDGLDVAIRVQLLRLILNVADCDWQTKMLFLSCREREQLGAPRLPSALLSVAAAEADGATAEQGQEGQHGFLGQIVDCLMKMEPDTPLRFWFTSIVDGFLRGLDIHFASHVVQSGLFVSLVKPLVLDVKVDLQTTFDLLGELIRFNPSTFGVIDSLCETPEQKAKFEGRVLGNLVDSNVFIRALLITTELCEIKQGEYWVIDTLIHEKRVRMIRELLGAVKVSQLTQENISCLNTGLLFLFFVHGRGTLRQVLCEVADEETRACGSASAVGFFTNLCELIAFWGEYYTKRGVDRANLEVSCRLSAEYWMRTTKAILAEVSAFAAKQREAN
eukprot:m51a1_g2280 hypothetical protein (780) ;mRNA; r:382352-385314